VNADNVTVWNQPLVDPTTGEAYPWDTRVLSCSGGYDFSVCGAAVSDVQNRLFCPITKPMRWLPVVQTPLPLSRPADTPGYPDDPAWNESWSWTLSSSERESSVRRRANFSRASPFLYVSSAAGGDAAAAQAAQLARRLTFSEASSAALSGLVSQLATSLARSLAANASVYDATLATPLARFAADPAGPIGDAARVTEALALYPGLSPLLLGTSSSQQRGQMQRNDAFSARPLKYAHANCSVLPRELRGNLSATLGRVLGNVDVSCVSMPGVPVASLDALHAALFAGYGKGATPRDVGGSPSPLANYPFAVDFGATNVSSKQLDLTLLYNSTPVFDLASYALSTFHRTNAPLNRLANAFAEMLLRAAPGAPRLALRYVRDMPTQGLQIRLDVGLLLGPLFYTWLSQMLLPVIVSLLVYEKEKNLRTMMKLQGLGDVAYVAVNYAYYFLLYFVYMLLIYLYGTVLGFGTNSLPMWTRSQPGVIVVFDLLFINVQVATAFLFQALFSNAKTATVGCVVYILISGLLGKFLFEAFLESPTFSYGGVVAMELLVPFSLYRGYYELASFGLAASYNPRGAPNAAGAGLTWAKLHGSRGMDDVMVIFLVEWVVIAVAAYYLDQVLATGSGVKRHPLFFLGEPLLRRCRRVSGAAADETEMEQLPSAVAVETQAADVLACRDAALRIFDAANVAVLARRLAKTYRGTDGGPPKVACRELSIAIPAGECFGLLGPNGAGKSTMIGLLIGFLEPSRGAAYIQGHDVQRDSATVYSLLGVCPQHDLLWETLSAREHLRFYGRLKNLSGAELEAACDEALRGVNLFHGGVGDRACGTYSGGMKRRLSVASAAPLSPAPASCLLRLTRRTQPTRSRRSLAHRRPACCAHGRAQHGAGPGVARHAVGGDQKGEADARGDPDVARDGRGGGAVRPRGRGCGRSAALRGPPARADGALRRLPGAHADAG
jgi:ABC-type transport system involved in cytochrome c biogenesis ATPase subunit